MTRLRCVSLGALMTLSPVAALPALGGVWNKRTRLTVHETIRVPGATLTPGKYIVKLADSPSNRNIVQFFNEDQSKIYSTVLAIPNQRMTSEITGDTQLVFYEARGGSPPALRAWFYPGDTYGQEFVYPKSDAEVIASSSGRNVPTMDDAAAKSLRSREDRDEAPTFDATTRIYMWSPGGREAAQTDVDADNMRKDRDKAWREQQRAYQRYGRFDDQAAANAKQNRMAPSDKQGIASDSRDKSIIVTRGIILPTSIQQREADISRVMAGIEQHGDLFERQFKKALNTSTIKIEDREELRVMVDRLEDTVDDLQEEYREKDYKEAHEKLREALEVAASVNRFMLRAEFGNAETSWNTLRQDLNTLAEAHTFPVIQVFTIRTAAK